MCKKKVIRAEIISNKKIAEDHYRMAIKSKHLAESSLPGQFVAVKVQDKTYDPLLRIPLGIHKIRKNEIELLYKVVGKATALLSSKKSGEKLDVLGPLGNGFDVAREFKKAVMVAGGHGVAPLYALAEMLIKKGKKIDFFIGAGTRGHVVCSKELEKLGAKVHVATEDGTRGYKGYVTELVEKHCRKLSTIGYRLSAMYACGPYAMTAAAAKTAKKYKIPAYVSLDAYMACGIGACLGCAVRTKSGYKMTCKDGPFFDAEEVVW